jgi:hypothetical protein
VAVLTASRSESQASLWGADQAAMSIAVGVGLSAAAFRHSVVILSPHTSPLVRHFHYMDSGMLTLWQAEHVYLNCANRPIAALHQMDRRHGRMNAWRTWFRASRPV